MSPHEEDAVITAINQIFHRFRLEPNVYLTEDDFRAHLFSSLLPQFGAVETTRDGDRSVSIHSEVRWYGNGSLKTRSDIVIAETSNLDVLRHSKLPSKGYGFNIPKAIIELKFRRPNGDSNTKFIKSIENDVEKLLELKSVFEVASGCSQTKYWMLVLDKKIDIKNMLPDRSEIEFKYAFANKSCHTTPASATR